MLSKVSWNEFLEAVGVLLVIYYGYIGFKYYKAEIQSLLSGKLQKNHHPANGPVKEDKFFGEKALSETSLDELEDVVNDLRYAILEKAGTQTTKEELLRQLQTRLANYSGLRIPAFRVAINNYLIVHANEICGIALSARELNETWDSI